MATIKEAFLALANYPKQEQVTGLRAGNAMTFVEAAAEALQADYSIVPRGHVRSGRARSRIPRRTARLPVSKTAH